MGFLCLHQYFKILTFGAVPFTLFPFLGVISTGLGGDDLLVGFGVVQRTSNIDGQIVIYTQGDEVSDKQIENPL